MPTPPHTTYQGFSLGLEEVNSHYPEDLPAERCRLYFKGNRLVIQSNIGGVYRYHTIDLTAVIAQSVSYSATPP